MTPLIKEPFWKETMAALTPASPHQAPQMNPYAAAEVPSVISLVHSTAESGRANHALC